MAGRDVVVRAPQARPCCWPPCPQSATGARGSPGCGPGLVSRRLAERVGELVASDVSQTAVALARERTGDLPGVSVHRSALPEVPFEGSVDLVVAAEFLYYVPDLEGALDVLWSRVRARRPPGRGALGPPPPRRVPQRTRDARPDPARLRGRACARSSPTPTRTSCSTSTRRPHEHPRPAGARRRRPVVHGRDADRGRGTWPSAHRGVDRSASPTSPTRWPRWPASTCAWRGSSRGTPTPCGSSTRRRSRRDPACTASGRPAPPGPASAPARPEPAGASTASCGSPPASTSIDRALLPGWVDVDTHLLFDIAADAVSADRSTLAHRGDGRVAVVHRAVDSAVAAATPVGPENFYLSRPRLPRRRARRRGRLGRRCAVGARTRSPTGLRRFAAVRPPDCGGSGVMEQAVWQARAAVDTHGTAPARPRRRARLARETTAARTCVVDGLRAGASTRPSRSSARAVWAATPGWPGRWPTSRSTCASTTSTTPASPPGGTP